MVKRALPLLLLAASGCSALVGGDTPQSTRCDPSTTEPCAFLGASFVCRPVMGQDYGECVPPDVMVPEMCDNDIDDDGDGMIDEGVPEVCDRADNDCDDAVDEEIDLDGDGFAGCVGSEFFEDCNDADPDVRPDDSVVEVCDGVDNDCNGTTVDGSGECGAMEVCQPPDGCQTTDCSNSPLCDPATEFCDMTVMPPVCRPSDTTCLGSGGPCEAPEGRCDPGSGNCIAPLANGEGCTTDAECLSDQCIDAEVVRLNSTDLGGQGVCAVLCCTDTQCGQGEVCWDSGSGTRVCLPEAMVAAEPQDTAVCSNNTQCSGERCGFSREDLHRVPNRAAATCGPDRSTPFFNCTSGFETAGCLGAGGSCVGDECFYAACLGASDCGSGLCNGRCLEVCGSTEECPALPGQPAPACTYVFAEHSSGRRDYLAVCQYEDSGQLGAGSPCGNHSECADADCVDDSGGLTGERRCRTRCCTDANCRSDEQCRPIALGMAYESVCMPRPVFDAGGP